VVAAVGGQLFECSMALEHFWLPTSMISSYFKALLPFHEGLENAHFHEQSLKVCDDCF
jgi:hypothetical protein